MERWCYYGNGGLHLVLPQRMMTLLPQWRHYGDGGLNRPTDVTMIIGKVGFTMETEDPPLVLPWRLRTPLPYCHFHGNKGFNCPTDVTMATEDFRILTD